MEELYQLIEEKIARSGYPVPVSGEEIYNEVCDEIDQKEPGAYLLMVKKDGDVFFEYKVNILEDQFDLTALDIHTPEQIYHVDFDA